MQATSGVYYKHSGTVGPAGLLSLLTIAGLGTLLAGAIYGYAIRYLPFVYINAMITAGFGFVVGILVSVGAKLGKIRNPGLVFFFGFLLGLFARYMAWVSWIHAVTDPGILTFSLATIFEVLSNALEVGTWSIFGWTPKGGALVMIWAIETIMIVGIATWSAGAIIGDTPFCKRCKRWVDESRTSPPLSPIVDQGELAPQLERADYSSLLELQPLAGNHYTELEFRECTTWNELHLLSVNRVQVKTDSDGKEEKEEESIAANLLLTPGDFRELEERFLKRMPSEA